LLKFCNNRADGLANQLPLWVWEALMLVLHVELARFGNLKAGKEFTKLYIFLDFQLRNRKSRPDADTKGITVTKMYIWNLRIPIHVNMRIWCTILSSIMRNRESQIWCTVLSSIMRNRESQSNCKDWEKGDLKLQYITQCQVTQALTIHVLRRTN
jgi:hypothetical protein